MKDTFVSSIALAKAWVENPTLIAHAMGESRLAVNRLITQLEAAHDERMEPTVGKIRERIDNEPPDYWQKVPAWAGVWVGRNISQVQRGRLQMQSRGSWPNVGRSV